jgi:hypothetical protein
VLPKLVRFLATHPDGKILRIGIRTSITFW